MNRTLVPILLCACFSLACAYIVVPADLLITPTSVASRGWSAVATDLRTGEAERVRIDLAIQNETQDWSAMQADPGKPAALVSASGKRSNCGAVFVGTGGTSLAPGFRMRGYTTGKKQAPVTQLLYVECTGGSVAAGSTLSIPYSYVTGPYDLHVPSVPVAATLSVNLDHLDSHTVFPIDGEGAGSIAKIDDKIPAINSFTLTLLDAKRTADGLDLEWQDYNPSEYPNYLHIGTPSVIGADGIIYGPYEDPSIADATITLSKQTAEWKTNVVVPPQVTGLYVLVSVETKQSKYFVSHVVDITDK